MTPTYKQVSVITDVPLSSRERAEQTVDAWLSHSPNTGMSHKGHPLITELITTALDAHASDKDKRIEQLEGMLKELEWSRETHVMSHEHTMKARACPKCGGIQFDSGHKPDCRLAALLNSQDGSTGGQSK